MELEIVLLLVELTAIILTASTHVHQGYCSHENGIGVVCQGKSRIFQ